MPRGTCRSTSALAVRTCVSATNSISGLRLARIIGSKSGRRSARHADWLVKWLISVEHHREPDGRIDRRHHNSFHRCVRKKKWILYCVRALYKESCWRSSVVHAVYLLFIKSCRRNYAVMWCDFIFLIAFEQIYDDVVCIQGKCADCAKSV